jgi:hypothetical protein
LMQIIMLPLVLPHVGIAFLIIPVGCWWDAQERFLFFNSHSATKPTRLWSFPVIQVHLCYPGSDPVVLFLAHWIPTWIKPGKRYHKPGRICFRREWDAWVVKMSDKCGWLSLKFNRRISL